MPDRVDCWPWQSGVGPLCADWFKKLASHEKTPREFMKWLADPRYAEADIIPTSYRKNLPHLRFECYPAELHNEEEVARTIGITWYALIINFLPRLR